MASLTYSEELDLQELLKMEGGYVLDFTNPTFQRFIHRSVGINIYDEKYSYASGSKANRLRGFWSEESEYITGKLILDLLEYWKSQIKRDGEITEQEGQLFDRCKKIAIRLQAESPVDNFEILDLLSTTESLSFITTSIKESIKKNEPEAALDRLHTFTTKFVRGLCDKYSIIYNKETPLQSIFGGYVKYLRQNEKFETIMAERILSSSISLLDAFNQVRNNHSFAHDNPLLNYPESLFIVNNVLSVLKLIHSIEKMGEETSEVLIEEINEEDIPF